jgi:4-amino-4-deoxy-L-arabinose transferase-like glycosyltransferase
LTVFNQFAVFLEKNPKYIYWFIILLLFPALLINLGLYPFNLDEATRAIVAMEMKFSGDYIVPTINGELYYNKPPLFNWIQLLFVNSTGKMEEWVFRLPVVVSLLGFGLTIFFTLEKELGSRVSLLAALAVITSGRILFYDSFKGLIDITFSWVIYLNFWTIYNNFSKKRYFRLFALSWFLTALGFMLKGMPSLVFQGITLLVYYLSERSFRKLFSIQHLAGILIFITFVGGYLLLYNQGNSLSQYIGNLWNESIIRTPVDSSFLKTL